MNTLFENFHFLRPELLLTLLPALAIAWWYAKHTGAGVNSGWQNHVDNHLLQYLMVGQGEQKAQRKSFRTVLFAGLIALIVGISGPTWEKRNVPAFSGNTPTLLVLSLAQSMNADDIKPTRLKRAVHKIRDILAKTQGDSRGLVIYSDRPFTASPLTTDQNVIENMLPELSTNLMPVLGNRLDLAVVQATELLQRGGARTGNIIVLTDDAGNAPDKSLTAFENAQRAGYRVSILGVGTEKGAELTVADGRKVADNNGNVITTAMNVAELEKLAQAGGGAFRALTPSNNDVESLLANETKPFDSAGDKQSGNADVWLDMGFWLLLIPALFMPFAFRRGAMLMVAVAVAMATMTPLPVYAQDAPVVASSTPSWWESAWQTPNQQGQAAFANGDYQQASNDFDNPEWQASADYKAGDFAKASQLFRQQKQDYNLGNALAKSGDLQSALNAYDRHLKKIPNDKDAQYNRDLVKKLLEQQKQKQERQKQERQKQEKQKQEKQKQEKQKQERQKQERQKQDEQKQDQQKQDQQKQDEQKQDEQPVAVQRTKQPLDQATEQILRRVPDDPSGLLRHRVRQYYQRQGFGQ